MTRTKPDTRLDEIAANVDQLTKPIHIAHRRSIHTLLPLLDQLRSAIAPATTVTNDRPAVPDSRPPINIDACDALSEIEVGIAGWHYRLKLPTPGRHADHQKTLLRALVGAYPSLGQGVQEWLHADVESWWELAARTVGWKLGELRRIR